VTAGCSVALNQHKQSHPLRLVGGFLAYSVQAILSPKGYRLVTLSEGRRSPRRQTRPQQHHLGAGICSSKGAFNNAGDTNQHTLVGHFSNYLWERLTSLPFTLTFVNTSLRSAVASSLRSGRP
jgi:hypothetical protein